MNILHCKYFILTSSTNLMGRNEVRNKIHTMSCTCMYRKKFGGGSKKIIKDPFDQVCPFNMCTGPEVDLHTVNKHTKEKKQQKKQKLFQQNKRMTI